MLKCDVCGKFISYHDLDAGRARHSVSPDNHFAPETSETLCVVHKNNFIADLSTNTPKEMDRVGG